MPLRPGAATPKPSPMPAPIVVSPAPSAAAPAPAPAKSLVIPMSPPASPQKAPNPTGPSQNRTASGAKSDPFAGLDSLEAEMARLLGRDP
jgi:hypothetical protein